MRMYLSEAVHVLYPYDLSMFFKSVRHFFRGESYDQVVAQNVYLLFNQPALIALAAFRSSMGSDFPRNSYRSSVMLNCAILPPPNSARAESICV